MKKMKHLLREFVQNNDGMETIEIAAIGIGVTILVGVLAGLYSSANTRSGEGITAIDDMEMPSGE